MNSRELTADPKFDPADLVDRLEINLKKSEEQNLAHWIDSQKDAMEQDRSDFLERHKRYLYNWDDFVTFKRKGPWNDSSQLHMPLTAIMVDRMVTRLYNIFTNESTTQLMPRETTDEAHVEMIRRLRKWYLWDYLNGYYGIRSFALEMFYDCATVGFGIGMKDWQVEMRKVLDIDTNELSREMQDMAPQVEEASQMPGAQPMASQEEMQAARVPVKPYKEVQKIITVFEGTRLQSIPFENAFFPAAIQGSSNLDLPRCVIIESEFTMSEINLKAKRGAWDKKKVRLVEDMGNQSQMGEDSSSIKEHRDRLSGVTRQNVDALDDKRTIQFVFCKYDIDDDGLDEEVVITKCQNVILKTTFLERISMSGMRPLFKFDCFPKPRQAYSRGVPEFMYPLNEEIDQHHNMRIDYTALQTCPFGVYRSASSLKNQPIRIAPGKFIPVEDINDMRVLNFNASATVLAQEEDRLWHYAEQLSNTSALSGGNVPDTVGPTRSTSGVNALLRQMDKAFIKTVDKIAEQWKKMEKMILLDLDFRISPQVKMRVLGATAEQALSPNLPMDQIAPRLLVNAQFDMHIDVARSVTSEEIQRNDAEMILNKIAAPSVLQQSGIVGPKAMYRAFCDWLKVMGVDEKNYISKPDMIDKPLSLFQEIQVCGQGDVPPMSMQDNHEEKAKLLVAFVQTPEYLEAVAKGLYGPQTQDVIRRAAAKHMQLAEQLKVQGLPNPTGQNQPNMNQTAAGTAPQQGGPDPQKTTSRELPPKPAAPAAPPNGGAPPNAGA